MISDSSPSNSSLLNFFDHVMTFNDSVVELTCCKSDGTEVHVTCGQGLSCSNACFAKEAVLCPSQNCGDCGNLDQEDGSEESEKRYKTRRRQKRQFSVATKPYWRLRYCSPRCPVLQNPECCFHPNCRRKRGNTCRKFAFFAGKSTLLSLSQIMII